MPSKTRRSAQPARPPCPRHLRPMRQVPTKLEKEARRQAQEAAANPPPPDQQALKMAAETAKEDKLRNSIHDELQFLYHLGDSEFDDALSPGVLKKIFRLVLRPDDDDDSLGLLTYDLSSGALTNMTEVQALARTWRDSGFDTVHGRIDVTVLVDTNTQPRLNIGLQLLHSMSKNFKRSIRNFTFRLDNFDSTYNLSPTAFSNLIHITASPYLFGGHVKALTTSTKPDECFIRQGFSNSRGMKLRVKVNGHAKHSRLLSRLFQLGCHLQRSPDRYTPKAAEDTLQEWFEGKDRFGLKLALYEVPDGGSVKEWMEDPLLSAMKLLIPGLP